jgi:pyridoxal 5'-phosphate synthase pdxT subunit
MRERRVGVLALQGDFALHAGLLRELGVAVEKVRRPSELEGCDALVLPGGESTTLRKLMRRSGLDVAIVDFARTKPVLGTCAGCILLAHDLEDAGGVEPLGLLDITVRRNGYGRQVDSFEATVQSDEFGSAEQTVSFIRAPRITRVGASVLSWGTHAGEVVAVRDGRIAALTFHPEVTGDPRWHRAWLGL